MSPKGDKIVFTSTRSGDLELYTMNIDGTDVKQITDELGYDGGAFFSPDGTKLIFRSSRPKSQEEVKAKMSGSFPATKLIDLLESEWLQLILKKVNTKSDNALNFISLFLMLNFEQK